jgi:hypothetical protein
MFPRGSVPQRQERAHHAVSTEAGHMAEGSFHGRLPTTGCFSIVQRRDCWLGSTRLGSKVFPCESKALARVTFDGDVHALDRHQPICALYSYTSHIF